MRGWMGGWVGVNRVGGAVLGIGVIEEKKVYISMRVQPLGIQQL